jgi:hypothetical protein
MNFIAKFKEIRNILILKIFLLLGSKKAQLFVKNNKNLKGKNLLIVIAFNQTWCLNWLLKMGKKNIKDAVICVFDNSNIQSKRVEIEKLSNKYKVIYYPLPPFNVRHPNRSHGLAMTWAYNKVVKHLQPKTFSFIDHDLIPIKPISISKRIRNQTCFGVTRDTINPFYWSLWAGYCIYNFASVKNRTLNFLNDFSRNLDTGGMNWNSIYKLLNKEEISFASRKFPLVSIAGIKDPIKVEFIDDHWLHVGGISYRGIHKKRIILLDKILSKLYKGYKNNYFR